MEEPEKYKMTLGNGEIFGENMKADNFLNSSNGNGSKFAKKKALFENTKLMG